MKKIIKLTESDLKRIVKRVISEQKDRKITIVTPGSNAEAEIKMDAEGNKVLVVKTETGREQSMKVKTALPKGSFMFEMGKDGERMFGYEPKTKKKFEIFSIELK
jgi:hypothetical protein